MAHSRCQMAGRPTRPAHSCAGSSKTALMKSASAPSTERQTEVFERLALYRLFPLLFLGNALAWLGAGWCRHRRTGEPCFFPGAALGGAKASRLSVSA